MEENCVYIEQMCVEVDFKNSKYMEDSWREKDSAVACISYGARPRCLMEDGFLRNGSCNGMSTPICLVAFGT